MDDSVKNLILFLLIFLAFGVVVYQFFNKNSEAPDIIAPTKRVISKYSDKVLDETARRLSKIDPELPSITRDQAAEYLERVMPIRRASHSRTEFEEKMLDLTIDLFSKWKKNIPQEFPAPLENFDLLTIFENFYSDITDLTVFQLSVILILIVVFFGILRVCYKYLKLRL